MIVTGYPSAVDSLYAIANNALGSFAVNNLPALSEIRWPGTDESIKPDLTSYWARCSDQLVIEQQRAMTSFSLNQRPYISIGLLIVQLFCPKAQGSAAIQNGRNMAVIVRNAFRRAFADGSLTFTKQQIKPLIYNDDSYQFNIVCTFEFSEFV